MATANLFSSSIFTIFFFLLILCCSVENREASNNLTNNDRFYIIRHPFTPFFPLNHANCQHSQGRKGGGAASMKVGRKITSNVRNILAQDQIRVRKLHDVVNKMSTKGPEEESTMETNRGISLHTANYVVTVELGTPSKTLSLAMDTGSDLTWTQCQPCLQSCYNQTQPIFDPRQSTTYSNISCSSSACSAMRSIGGSHCSSSSKTACDYTIEYGDNSVSSGYLAKDRLTLTGGDFVQNFTFGCGQIKNTGSFGETAGIMGLARDSFSLVSQTAKNYDQCFSYCLPTVCGSGGHLTFGKTSHSRSSVSARFTRLLEDDLFYYFRITAITVAGNVLPINTTVFQTPGTIIDSGTVITRLQPVAYKQLRSAFKKEMSEYKNAAPFSPTFLDTCYDLSNQKEVSVPKISFLVNKHLSIDLPPEGIMVSTADDVKNISQVCLAFAGNQDARDSGIFGNIQQQTFEVVYNVAAGLLGFAPRGCS